MSEVKHDDVSQLKSLGSGKTDYPNEKGADPSVLEKFPNQFPDREYVVEFSSSEITSLCPKTAQPDFFSLLIRYVPDQEMIESKGLKLYLFSYRNEQSFMETITNNIITHLVELVHPRWMVVEGTFAPRGGIGMRVMATYSKATGKYTVNTAGVSSVKL